MFHPGHKHLLASCARQCDHLIVAVNSDASVKRLKGPTRPHDPLETRIHNVWRYLRAKRGAQFGVLPFEGDEGMLLMAIRPQILFKGYDHSVNPVFYRRIGWKNLAGPAFEGPRIVQIDQLPGHSTTALLEARREA